MTTEFYRFKLSDSLNTAKRTVDEVVAHAKLESTSKIKASEVIEGIDGVIEENWKGLNGAKLKPLSPSDNFSLHMYAQDAIIADLFETTEKKAARNPEVAKKLNQAALKASSFNRIAGYTLKYAQHANYNAVNAEELTEQQKQEINDIIKGENITQEYILEMLKTRKPEEYAAMTAQMARLETVKTLCNTTGEFSHV